MNLIQRPSLALKARHQSLVAANIILRIYQGEVARNASAMDRLDSMPEGSASEYLLSINEGNPARAIKMRERMLRARKQHRELESQRTGAIRQETRLVHLARAFLRGTAYERVEPRVHRLPDFEKVLSIVRAHCDVDLRIINQRFAAWADAGRERTVVIDKVAAPVARPLLRGVEIDASY